MQLTYSENGYKLDVKYIATSTAEFTLLPGTYENSDLNLMLKSLLPDDVKLKITIDDIRLRPNLTINKTKKFTEKSFFYTILGFTQSQQCRLDDPSQRRIEKNPGTYRSGKLISITGID